MVTGDTSANRVLLPQLSPEPNNRVTAAYLTSFPPPGVPDSSPYGIAFRSYLERTLPFESQIDQTLPPLLTGPLQPLAPVYDNVTGPYGLPAVLGNVQTFIDDLLRNLGTLLPR